MTQLILLRQQIYCLSLALNFESKQVRRSGKGRIRAFRNIIWRKQNIYFYEVVRGNSYQSEEYVIIIGDELNFLFHNCTE
jgi:hypothetical protein